jgi:hypothetical protein
VSAAIDQLIQVDGGESADAVSDCTALVPVMHPLRLPLSAERLARPDPSFVTQLIATAEHAPQTCALRRASPAAAQAAYGSVTNQVGIKTPGREIQQII